MVEVSTSQVVLSWTLYSTGLKLWTLGTPKLLATAHPGGCIILFVTEDQELAHGYKSHQGGHSDSTFQDRLKAEGISHSQIIHIKYIDVWVGVAYADNLTCLTSCWTGNATDKVSSSGTSAQATCYQEV